MVVGADCYAGGGGGLAACFATHEDMLPTLVKDCGSRDTIEQAVNQIHKKT